MAYLNLQDGACMCVTCLTNDADWMPSIGGILAIRVESHSGGLAPKSATI